MRDKFQNFLIRKKNQKNAGSFIDTEESTTMQQYEIFTILKSLGILFI